MAAEPLALSLLRRVAETPGEAGWLETPAGRVRTLVRGPASAPELLLLHGMGDSIPGWSQALLPLSLKFRVHTFDLPGHGLSEAPPDYALSTFVAAARAVASRLREPLVVGHSLGGWLALRLVLEGAAVKALTLVNPAGAVLPREEWEPFRARVSATDAAGARAYLKRAFHRPPLPLWLFPGEVLKAMAAPASQGLLASIRESDFVHAAELAALRVPTRVIWGAEDRLLPGGTLPFFQRAIPHAELVALPGCGHCPHLEAPLRLARAISRPFPVRNAASVDTF